MCGTLCGVFGFTCGDNLAVHYFLCDNNHLTCGGGGGAGDGTGGADSGAADTGTKAGARGFLDRFRGASAEAVRKGNP